jgi:hypothetical protein
MTRGTAPLAVRNVESRFKFIDPVSDGVILRDFAFRGRQVAAFKIDGQLPEQTSPEVKRFQQSWHSTLISGGGDSWPSSRAR